MSIKYKADWAVDVLAGYGFKATTNFDEKFLCHEFALTKSNVPESLTIELLTVNNVVSSRLFGPASSLESKTLIYPCNRYYCRIPCPCNICHNLMSSSCQVPESYPCSCKVCSCQFQDHSNFHRAYHINCKFCLQLLLIFPVYNFWFLNDAKRVLLYSGSDSKREHFQIKDLVVNRDPPVYKQNPNSAEYYTDYDYYYKTKKSQLEYFGWKTCEECNYSVQTIDQFKEHIELNHQISKRFFHCYIDEAKEKDCFKCYKCSANYGTRKELTRHVMKEHYKKTHNCESCTEVFTREDHLKRHKELVHNHNNSMYVCLDCGKNFSRQDALTRHKTFAHETSNDLLCDQCNATFNMKSNLDRHKKSAVNQDGSVKNCCNACEEYFCTGKLLRKHQTEKHIVIELSCDDCGQHFSAKRSLELHVKRRNYVSCNKCNAILCNLASLKKHKESIHQANSNPRNFMKK